MKLLRFILGRTLLVLFGVLFAFVMLEVLLRVTDATPEVTTPLHGFHRSHPVFGWIGEPNARRRFVRAEFDALVEHTGEGFRRPEPPLPDNPEEHVLVLGDSFTWGWGVGQGEVFTDWLQRELTPRVAVHNRGVNAFGTAQQYLLLQRELEEIPHDTVILVFTANDIADNLDDRRGRRPHFDLVNGELIPRNQPPAPLMRRWERFLRDHSRALVWVSERREILYRAWKRWRRSRGPDAPPREITFSDAEFAVTTRLLGEMARLCSDRGARFFVVVQRETPELRAKLGAMFASAGVRTVDLAPAFEERMQRGATLIFATDGHWTPAGHRLVAEVLLASPVFREGPPAAE